VTVSKRFSEARSILASRLERWVPEGDLYDAVDALVQALADEDWEIVQSAWIGDLCMAHEAALAVAGAELDGHDQERAWANFEATMETSHGPAWIDAAAMALEDLRKT